mmetsp:Transcript_24391/g.69575  ORF Transcript_24391/g.69575 Transcript_24391/m.69575 type:complete len:137 (+) Transcript_24391:2121-2531(+)
MVLVMTRRGNNLSIKNFIITRNNTKPTRGNSNNNTVGKEILLSVGRQTDNHHKINTLIISPLPSMILSKSLISSFKSLGDRLIRVQLMYILVHRIIHMANSKPLHSRIRFLQVPVQTACILAMAWEIQVQSLVMAS